MSPASTISPTATWMACTTPAVWAITGTSIFIDSSSSSVCPATTASPLTHSIAMTTPLTVASKCTAPLASAISARQR